MIPTKEQWEQIERQLGVAFGAVELVCDGYKIHAMTQQDRMKLVVAVYVNGNIEFRLVFDKSSEIPRKFWHERKSYRFTGRLRAWYLKESKSRIWSKEKREEYAAAAKETLSLWEPYWPSPKALCRHLRKTCTSIEVVKIGY